MRHIYIVVVSPPPLVKEYIPLLHKSTARRSLLLLKARQSGPFGECYCVIRSECRVWGRSLAMKEYDMMCERLWREAGKCCVAVVCDVCNASRGGSQVSGD